MMTTRHWVNWVNVILGSWLIAWPRLITLAGGDSLAAWNSWSAGAGIVTLAGFALYKPTVWGDAVGVVLGLWLIASPWMLGFTALSGEAENAVIVGLLVIGYAFWAMRIDINHQRQRRAKYPTYRRHSA